MWKEWQQIIFWRSLA